MDSVLPELRVHLDRENLAGRWFKIARTADVMEEPVGATDLQTTHTWNGNRLDCVTVGRNDGLAFQWSAMGTPDTAFNTRFTMRSRAYHFPYRVLDFDARGWLVIAADEQNRRVWVLAREILQTKEWWIAMLDRLEQEFGVDLKKLSYVTHTESVPDVTPQQQPLRWGAGGVLEIQMSETGSL